jgi:hypothetical protein
MPTSATAQHTWAEAGAGIASAGLATIAFVVWRDGSARWASALPGHLLGVVGVLLMLWAGFAYTWRKRRAAPGPSAMRGAMRAHIVAGLVGPYLVILHSGFAFAGVAGASTLAMVLVVASGLVGRALFTAVPRQVEVADPVRAAMLDAEMARLETQLAELARAPVPDDARRSELRGAMTAVRHEQEHLRNNWRDAGPAVVWRRVLSVWWFLHVPVSMALWILAAAHIAGALYYATFSL